MATEMPQEWFLEVQGKKTGPFSTEQILGLLRDGEVPEQARITSESMLGRWMTVRQLADAHEVPRDPIKPFSPPPRPQDLASISESDPHALPPQPPSDDPANNLFDALQAAKEHKAQAGRAFPPPSTPTQSKRDPLPSFKKVPPKLWALIGAGLLLLLAIWGLVQWIEKKSPASVSSVRESEPAAPVRQEKSPPPAITTSAGITVSRPTHHYTPPPSRPAPLPQDRSMDRRRDEHPEHDTPPPHDISSEPPHMDTSLEGLTNTPPVAESPDIAQPQPLPPGGPQDPSRQNVESDPNPAPPPPQD